ncbi:MAG: tRNA (N(6)-L-threonylcarbamoyladenosine(37)-C(2))-methylthiotransferase MtaB [Candidatus Omnitrophica bacterium]|nr:tRNA (N(6)-L-threonylcarbamoyladenosine(37)-C(2))-methylthiotransferase MtaB [Candidatus Omnitrophota bacterium]
MRTIKFFTVGCKVNQYEIQVIREQFINADFVELENNRPADFYVVNTCTVTHRADSDSLYFIRRAEKENPKAQIFVTGCLTEFNSEKILKEGRHCLIFKNKDKFNILLAVTRLQGFKRVPVPYGTGRVLSSAEPKIILAFPQTSRISYFKNHTRAFLKIQDGCNNFCSFCKIPLVRGKSRSRSLSEIINEAKGLSEFGYKEIVLCGICLGAYGRDLNQDIDLVNVVEALEKIEGLSRIRLSSIEPQDLTERLIKKVSNLQKFCPHLHIPLQSGDDEVLKRMNRRYSRKQYLELIISLKRLIPRLCLTTDVLVGFPGEREGNFENTVSLIKEIQPLKVHIFPYSKREETKAAQLKDAISINEIKKRVHLLKVVAEKASHAYKAQFLNKTLPVLIEKEVERGFWQGRTDNYLKVAIPSLDNLKNQIIPVRLKEIRGDIMLGENSLTGQKASV